MKCLRCGTEFEGNFCPNCSAPAAGNRPVGNPAMRYDASGHYRKKKKSKFWNIVIIILGVLIVIGMLLPKGKTTEPKRNSESTFSESTPQEPKENDIESAVYQILKHHTDVALGSISDAGAAGSWAALELNLSMYKEDGDDPGIKYCTCYYAMYGAKKYKEDFGDLYTDKITKTIETVRLAHEGELLSDEELSQQKAKEDEKKAIDKQEYIDSATTIEYSDLIRTPDKYEGTVIKVTVKISQVMAGGFLTESGYRAYSGDDEWYISYSIPEGEPRIIENDTIVFYGEFYGLDKLTRALTGVTEYIPKLTAKFHEFK